MPAPLSTAWEVAGSKGQLLNKVKTDRGLGLPHLLPRAMQGILPPSLPQQPLGQAFGKAGTELRALGRGLWAGGAARVCSGMGWYPQGCG